MKNKIINAAFFLDLKNIQLKNKKIVFTNGCFDILHRGHITYLNKARQYGDILVIGLNTDNSIKRLKGESRPVNLQEDRSEMLAALSIIDYVILFDEDTPLNLINFIKPDVLVKGADYSIDNIVGAKEVIGFGGEVKTIELVAGKSTTNILNKMRSKISLSISIPALNEEKNVGGVIEGLIEALNKANIVWQLILINDGSSDNTLQIMQKFKEKYLSEITIINHSQNAGLGYSIREAIKYCKNDFYTWFPSDGENLPEEFLKYILLLEHIDILIPFAVNKGVRSLFRRILSTAYLMIINISFGTMFNYTNGNIIYRKKLLDALDLRSDSFFFQTETLIKAIHSKKEILFAEVPIILNSRAGGKTKALRLKNILGVVYDYFYLLFFMHIYLRFFKK